MYFTTPLFSPDDDIRGYGPLFVFFIMKFSAFMIVKRFMSFTGLYDEICLYTGGVNDFRCSFSLSLAIISFSYKSKALCN